jgi:pimeloyl-ACP methyl ester carboxylesterase
MDVPASENKPIVDTPTAVKDVGSAVNHILQKRTVPKINLMGWSWGTAIMGMYTAEHNDKVSRLVQYAPMWLFKGATPIGGDGPLPAYRNVTRESSKERWLKGVAESKKADLIPAGWFEQWADATWATDPVGAKQNPPVLRAPNGVLADANAYWIAGKPQYDPGDIKVPTLIIHAEWDADLPSYHAQAYFAKLTNAPYKRFVELGEGTHYIMMEKNRMQFFHEVMTFLTEANALALSE